MSEGENIRTKTHKLKNPISNGHYVADAAVVWCFDERFRQALKEYQEAHQLDRIDRIVLAGGAKGLASPGREADRELIIDQLLKSKKLHHTKKIVLMIHSDCGAYGGLSKFGNDRKVEMEHQRGELMKAKETLGQIPELKDVPVDMVFVDFEAMHNFETLPAGT